MVGLSLAIRGETGAGRPRPPPPRRTTSVAGPGACRAAPTTVRRWGGSPCPKARSHARGAVELLVAPGTLRPGDPEATPAPESGSERDPAAGSGSGIPAGGHGAVALGAVAFGLSLGVWALWAWLPTRRDVAGPRPQRLRGGGPLPGRWLRPALRRHVRHVVAAVRLPAVRGPVLRRRATRLRRATQGDGGASVVSLVLVVWCAWGMLGLRWAAGRLAATLAVSAVALWLEPVAWTLMWGPGEPRCSWPWSWSTLARPELAAHQGDGHRARRRLQADPPELSSLSLPRWSPAAYRAAAVAGAALSDRGAGLGWLSPRPVAERYWFRPGRPGPRPGQPRGEHRHAEQPVGARHAQPPSRPTEARRHRTCGSLVSGRRSSPWAC